MNKARSFFSPRLLRLGNFLALSSLTLALLPGAFAAEAAQLVIKADRSTAIYKRGEPVQFRIVLKSDDDRDGIPGETTVFWQLTRDGCEPSRQGEIVLKNGVGQVSGQLDQPGFLQCKVTARVDGRELSGLGGAAVAPLQIAPTQVMPDDFDAFWASKKAELAKVPIDAKLTPVPSRTEGVEAFDLQAKCLGIPVSAYYARPLHAKPKSLPAILSVHGAGVNTSSLEGATGWAAHGMLSVDLNAHGLPNGRSKEFYASLKANEYRGYPYWGRRSREESYFLGMFLRVLRAIDFLAAQPEWDGRTIIVRGNSQGGAQALAAAGLDERVTFFAAGVPAMCDHSGALTKDPAGWPGFIKLDGAGKPVDQRIVETSRYFDAVNFMRRTRAEGFFTVGFIDTTCRPTTVYAAYNTLETRKEIFNDIAVGHTNTPEAGARGRAAIMKHVRSQNEKP